LRVERLPFPHTSFSDIGYFGRGAGLLSRPCIPSNGSACFRHQLNVLQRSVKRPKLTASDRFFWACLAATWRDWRSALIIVRAETVITAYPWSAAQARYQHRRDQRQQVHGARIKAAISDVENIPGNHLKSVVSIDFFTVPTLRFQILYVFLVLAHDRRRILHFGVTAHPTAEWTAQQLREAFPWDSAPRFLLRDRDRIFGSDFTKQVEELGIEEVLGVPRAPQQRAYIERVIGTIRRECLDHLIVFDEASLLRQMKSFLTYYHETRTHLSLEKDTPSHRPVQEPASGGVVAIPQVGGLHHRYERRAA
jgi:transposase InsO family protein